ncbi:hypothetical protein CSC70_01580 [Pseudoxanthomonas kalamensis DSM 18571]|uniref:DUF7673 family protein n=1 Tax=Pseudoxanthomonas kalamensis TaxID=289483 RepID=UPI00139073E7|nr:hypothetical protein [Pseudoxanthomonas kalamensis]KAF1712246.1 hypothetical protein CSC70_01580 [Pseudoxanthomonas kalamensis DSM 18571]
MRAEQQAALERLIHVARNDTGQSRRSASFLLAWWNATTCGGFDLTDFWAVDAEIREDMLMVVQMAADLHCYPDEFGYRDAFEALVEQWRPHLIQNLAPD